MRDSLPIDTVEDMPAKYLPKANLVELAGETHSFQNMQGEIVDETLVFLES